MGLSCNRSGRGTPFKDVETETTVIPLVPRWGTRIEDLRDRIRGTVLSQYGMAFAAVMDNQEVRYYGKTDPQFRLVRTDPP